MSDDSCVDWDLLNWPGIFKGVVSILLGKFFPTAKAEARMKSCRTSKEEKEEAPTTPGAQRRRLCTATCRDWCPV